MSGTPVPDRGHVQRWLERYEEAWRAAGTSMLAQLFTDDATYRLSPFEQPIAGIPAIARMWEAERLGPDERFEMTSTIVAVDRELAVVRVTVRYQEPTPHEYRDLWIVRFGQDGRCREFEEWPFWPGQPRTPPEAR
jgi:hypothetical protein